jgi:hypothetical protein
VRVAGEGTLHTGAVKILWWCWHALFLLWWCAITKEGIPRCILAGHALSNEHEHVCPSPCNPPTCMAAAPPPLASPSPSTVRRGCMCSPNCDLQPYSISKHHCKATLLCIAAGEDASIQTPTAFRAYYRKEMLSLFVCIAAGADASVPTCMAAVPTPPLAPSTSTVCPGCRLALSRRARCAVPNTIGTDDAAATSRPAAGQHGTHRHAHVMGVRRDA